MTTSRKTLLAIGLIATLAAGTALSAPARFARGDAFLPPQAAELGLAGAQARQWDALREDAIALRRVARTDLHDSVTDLRGLLDQPSPDLRGFSAESQRRVDAHLIETRALHARQLALYDSLSPQQQARVRAAMAERLDRLALLRERFVTLTGIDA